MKRTVLALSVTAAALAGCITTEQLQVECTDRATLAGVRPSPEWMGACTRQLARQYNDRFAAEVAQGYAAAQAARPRTCTTTGVGMSAVTTCY